jgi:hypothetical protein
MLRAILVTYTDHVLLVRLLSWCPGSLLQGRVDLVSALACSAAAADSQPAPGKQLRQLQPLLR